MTDIERFKQALVEFSPVFDFQLTDTQLSACAQHYDLLLKWNKRLNLTRITEPVAAAQFHYAESLFAAKYLDASDRVIDIGSGAGFPGIPLAIGLPDMKFRLLDGNARKVTFLRESIRLIGLKNTEAVAARFGEFVPDEPVWIVRAIEEFESLLPMLFNSPIPKRLVLFLGDELLQRAEAIAGSAWRCAAYPLPLAKSRALLVADRV